MILFILLLCAASTIAAPTTSYTEEDARNFIKDTSEEFFDFFDTLSRSTFEYNDNGNFFEILQRLNLLEGAAKNLTLMAKKAENYPYESFKDEEVKLGMRNIRMSSYLYILGEEYFKKLIISTNYLKELATDTDICKFKSDDDDCELAYMPDIHKIISETDDEAELKYYWETWRDHNNKFGSEHLQIFIDLFKKAATLTDTKPLDLWYRIYMDSEFLADMEKVMKELEPFYKKIHSYIRYDLNKKYGDKIVPKDGPIPYHLFDKVLVQNWIRHVVEPPYPDYQLPDLDTRVKEMVEKEVNKTLLHIADEFYESMGIIDADKAFFEDDNEDDEDHVKNLDEKSGSNDCKAEIYAQSRYYYLKTCPQITFRKYLQTHGWAIPVYFVQQKKLPYANFQSYNFEVPSGEAVILSASSPKHLAAVGLLTDKESQDDELRMNRFFKMSVHTMLNIPMFFVHSKVMNDLLSGEVTIENVNEYYWKLMKQYAGVVPPMERTKESFDFPYKFYEDLENNHQTTKFVSEIAGYQIYSSLCKKSEIDQPSLHNCDFYKSKKAGDILKEFMKIGSTKPWRESLSVITGDKSGLSGNAILEYYEPISDWLNTHIKDKHISVGW